ncbi:PE domain-containing protein [Actinokineospora terrae]|uniref:PE family protein n=1 Tax=Actinokineospora terrae TaxID=155974 RepID=A0A1H9W1A5_9PSEU|nr:PE domain-containing protein [Actinokineospora terrae]SES27584.1 PE family protein [Actinokineospora terrae]
MTDTTQSGALAAVTANARMAANSLHHPTATSAGQFLINHDNVLAAAKVIQTQIDSLQDRIKGALVDLNVVPPGDDDVSVQVAQEWNERLSQQDGSYRQRVVEYMSSLNDLVRQLQESAKTYGYTEQEIATAIGTRVE